MEDKRCENRSQTKTRNRRRRREKESIRNRCRLEGMIMQRKKEVSIIP